MGGPSRWWYAVAGAIGVLGMAAGVWLVVAAFVDYLDRIDDLQRIPVGSTDTVELDDAGGYTVYYEQRDTAFDAEVPPGLDVTFACEGGFEPRLEEYDDDVTYEDGGREGVGAFSFSVPEPMRCDVSASVLSGEPRRGARIAIGESVHREPVRQGALGCALAIFSVLVAGTMALVVALARIRGRRSAFPPARPGT